MANTLKEMFYNKDSISALGDLIISSYPKFNKTKFLKLVFDSEWQNRELKDRSRHVTTSLNLSLDKPYPEALNILLDVNDKLKEVKFIYTVFPEYVAVYGQDYFDDSMFALKEMTRNSTSEFAIRPFILSHQQEAMQLLFRWSKDEDKHVRRLSSEGCRPILPWGGKLMNFVRDPTPILPILNNLKEDPELYVQRSVANSLNDISKDHPALVLDIASTWKKINNPGTQFIVKHACRTLLKKGNQEALNLFGVGDISSISVSGLKVEEKKIQIGQILKFNFKLTDKGDDIENDEDDEESGHIRVEYRIDFLKANGTHTSKVFMLRNKKKRTKGTIDIASTQKFEQTTTRKLHPGKHYISIVVNGVEKAKTDFTLLPEDEE